MPVVPGERSQALTSRWHHRALVASTAVLTSFGRSAVTTPERFKSALAASAAELAGPELLPERLARAAVAVMPIDGAGISLFFAGDRRLPLGASDDQSAEAERLQ